MTIVTKNSLTLSNVNDGTITHYAYAKSADGTDRFSTIYPRFNLLSGTAKFDNFNPNSSDNLVSTITKTMISGINNTVMEVKTSGNAFAVGYYLPNAYSVTEGQTITISFMARGTNGTNVWVGFENIQNGVKEFKLTPNWELYTYTFTATTSGTSTFYIYGWDMVAGQWFQAYNPKAEPGSTATPYMPSASEVTTADWPSYIGQYTDFTQSDSTNPSDYTWSRIRGNDGKPGLDGKDGNGIKTTDITYAISTSGTTAPTTGWTSSVPSLVNGQYFWTKTVWTYTDNSSKTGYSVTYISKDGSNGDPGKVVSDTEPTTLFKGLTWKYSGTADLTASDGTVILSGTEYYWSGTNWILSEINAHNINVDDLSAISTTLTNGKFISNWSSDNATGTTTIEKNHLIINSANASLNTKNTIALDNEQGMMMTYTNTINKRMISAGVNFQGLFVTDSKGPYAEVTPTGVVTSADVPWTSIGTYADYKRDGNVVTIRVVDAITTTAGDITLGRIPSKDGPIEPVMGPAIAWSAVNTNDKHLQINAASGGAVVTILDAVANKKYTFQFSYQI